MTVTLFLILHTLLGIITFFLDHHHYHKGEPFTVGDIAGLFCFMIASILATVSFLCNMLDEYADKPLFNGGDKWKL